MQDAVTTARPTRRPRGFPAGVVAVLAASVVAVLICTVVAAIAHGAGASDDFQALTVPVFSIFVWSGRPIRCRGRAGVRSSR